MRIATGRLFCALVFVSFFLSEVSNAQEPIRTDTTTADNYRQTVGFKVVTSKYGEVNFKLFGYVRYVNQLALDPTYTNAFGKTSDLVLRNQMQVQKAVLFFNGWFMDPKFRYTFYVWTSNSSQGQGAQVVVAGFLSYVFSKNFILSGGILSLPGVRFTEGNFPYWLSVDNRMISDEYFRPSYTTGISARGEITPKLAYAAMIGNNLSQLGIDASELDNEFNTFSGALVYYPTTGEYGMLGGSYGDFENHQKVATRIGAHYTSSTEDRQGQPNTTSFDNVQIRVSDGSTIFLPNLFNDGTQIEKARYQMTSFDGGVKCKGLALEGEYYMRWVDNFSVTGAPLSFSQLTDNGFQLQGSVMVMPKKLQVYATYAKINGQYGNPDEYRGGVNFFPFNTNTVRINGQYSYEHRCPVGGTSYPYQVGATGPIYNIDFEVRF
jgi:hypothetical protein